MRSYAQYCPVAKATEILGDRWTLLIVREMLGGASGFNELQRGLPGISRSVLTDRMRALERAEVIERRTGPKGRTLEYRLTPAGRDLRAGRAGDRRVGGDLVVHRSPPRGARPRPVDRLDGPPRRSRAAPTRPNRGPVRLSRPQASATGWSSSPPRSRSASSIPGSTSTSRSTSTPPRSTASTLGRAELGGAIRAGQLTMSGPRTLQRGFGRWFTWSAFAPASRSAEERRTAASRLASPHR